jgi:competence protein ComEC
MDVAREFTGCRAAPANLPCVQQMVAVAGLVQARSSAWVQAWVAIERDRLPLWLPVFMGTGILCYFALRAESPGWLGAAVAVPAVVATMLLGSRPALRAIMMSLAAAAIGLASAQFATWRAPPAENLPTHATVLTGTVRGVEALPEGRRITLEAAQLDDAPPLSRWLRIRLRGNDQAAIAAGDTIRVRALVRPPAPPALPGCLGPPTRRLVQRARRVRLCARFSGSIG